VTSNYAGGAGSLTFTPAIYTTTGRQNVTAGGMPNSGAIVKVGAGASELLNGSLAFYRDAFTFVTADLPMPKGTDMAASSTYDGITVSLVRDFDIATRDFKTRLDILYGFAALRPQLACRIHADG
jgi:P22 coat protein - gene protein 5